MSRGRNLNGLGRAVVLGAAVFSLAGVGRVAAQEVVADPARTVTLEQAMRLALERNQLLMDARLALDGAEERVQEAWGNLYPTVNANASYTRNLSVPSTFLPAIIFNEDADPDELIPVQFGADNTWSTQIRLEQPIFEAAAFIGVGAADRFEALQEEVVRGAAQRALTRTRVAYYDVLLAQEALRLSENSVRRIRETLEETRALNRAGLASEYDVLRLEVELANIEPNLRRARNGVSAAKRRLGIELGIEDAESIAVVGSLAGLEIDRIADAAAGEAGASEGARPEVLAFAGLPDPAQLEEARVVQMALERRSDLRQLDLTADLRQTELRLEQAEYLPSVSLFGVYSINAQQNGDPAFFGANSSQRAYGRQVGIQVTLPLFSGFQRPARVSQRRVEVRRAETQYRLAVDQAENDVRTLFEQLREARARADGQHLAVDQARRGFEIASTQYGAGLGSQLQVTDAEVALRQSEFNYAQAVYDYLVARARLDEAVGVVPLVDTDQTVALDG